MAEDKIIRMVMDGHGDRVTETPVALDAVFHDSMRVVSGSRRSRRRGVSDFLHGDEFVASSMATMAVSELGNVFCRMGHMADEKSLKLQEDFIQNVVRRES